MRLRILILNLILTLSPLLATQSLGSNDNNTSLQEQNDVGSNIADDKVIELKKIVNLTALQERLIRDAYKRYKYALDSALYDVADPYKAAQIKYDAGKRYNMTLMSTLTEIQRNKYIKVTSTPEVEAKTEYKLELLAESGEYTEEELATIKPQIFNYLMAEKIVYARDKYDIKKQKENIARLKNIIPKALKASNAFEKIKGQGRLIKGNIHW